VLDFGQEDSADLKDATACEDGPAWFAACSGLFRSYPLAVMRHPADDGYQSMIMVNRSAGTAAFFALTRTGGDLFVLRPWCRQQAVGQEIRPGVRVPDVVGRAIAESMPIPRDRALLGWVIDRQVTAMLMVQSGSHQPEIRVMPVCRGSELDWPPFTASPLSDGRLWDYVERGQLVDIGPLLAQSTGQAFWVPRPYGRGMGYVVVSGNLPADQYWLPAGIYMDHWLLREGMQAPPAQRLLALPGALDLATLGPQS
jgi:hypothetical protein